MLFKNYLPERTTNEILSLNERVTAKEKKLGKDRRKIEAILAKRPVDEWSMI